MFLPTKEAPLKAAAQTFLDALIKEDFAGVRKDFDPAMQEALPAAKLQELWKGITDQAGPFRKQLGMRSDRAGKYDILFMPCQFEKTSLDFKIVFDGDRRIAGFSIVPPAQEIVYKPPVYVNNEAFRDTEVQIGSGPWALPGSLSLPRDGGPFPAVVLVHGSGPLDRDENILGNRPFRDLAWGLACAVLPCSATINAPMSMPPG